MATQMRKWMLAGLIGLLAACGGGGGGGDRAPGVEPGPPAPGQPVPPPPIQPTPPPAHYAEAEELRATITSVDIPDDGRAVVEWQLTDGNGVAITDLETSNVRFTLAKLRASDLGNLTGNWQSYINRIEFAGSVGPGTEDRLQATAERGAGEFTNNGDGTYRYRLAASVLEPPADIQAQADSQGIDLSYEPERTHRVAMQFDGSRDTANPVYDWVPATGATSGVFNRDVVATDNCNNCHNPLGLHGGNRRDTRYCVTCHNPGSSDANSGNTVDFKVMVHKIHRGANLPSVLAGGEYAIWGFNDTKHDYSHLELPQDIRNCTSCHAGSATIGERDNIAQTSNGDNWNEYPQQAVCGACHDDLDFSQHAGGQPDDSNCASCHAEDGQVGPIRDSHRILAAEASARFLAEVLGVTGTAPGETPAVTYRISNPETGEDYDLANDPAFAGASVNVRVSWDTRDYHNTGNGEDNASAVGTSALTGSANGDGSYTATLPIPLPDGSQAPGIAVSGSGVAVIEGRLSIELEEGEEAERVPLTNAHGFFSIDEPDGTPFARRDVVDLDNCLNCHVSLSLHGGNRTDNINSCVTCHNPRNTDRGVREIAADPPTDGKQEESLHFKTMIHAIHAAGIRENPIQIVGFQGRSTHVFDEEHVHFPGNLADCESCHDDDTYTLPLPDGVLGTSVDTGDDRQDPTDDLVITPIAATCSSCHDDAEAGSHMRTNGANFATTQAAIDSGDVVEECTVCHGEGRIADVEHVHEEHTHDE